MSRSDGFDRVDTGSNLDYYHPMAKKVQMKCGDCGVPQSYTYQMHSRLARVPAEDKVVAKTATVLSGPHKGDLVGYWEFTPTASCWPVRCMGCGGPMIKMDEWEEYYGFPDSLPSKKKGLVRGEEEKGEKDVGRPEKQATAAS